MSKRLILAKLVMTVAAMALLCSMATAQPTYTRLDFPNAHHTYALGINNTNQIVGIYVDLSFHAQGFLFTDGSFTSVQFPGAYTTYANGINDSGVIVGQYIVSGTDGHGYMYDGTTFTTLDRPGYRSTSLNGINNAGMIVGSALDTNGVGSFFEYSNGVFTDITFPAAIVYSAAGINNSGDVVGTYAAIGGRTTSYLLTAEGTRHIVSNPDSLYTGAFGVNDLRDVVGDETSQGMTVGFADRRGVYLPIIPPGTSSEAHARGINNAEYIVGSYLGRDNINHGYLRTP